MSNTTKGVWHRPEAEKGAYADGYERIWGGADGVRNVHGSQDAPSQADGPEQVQPPVPHAATEARG